MLHSAMFYRGDFEGVMTLKIWPFGYVHRQINQTATNSVKQPSHRKLGLSIGHRNG